METITLPVSKEYSCDVLVVGGGVTGTAAAICAARKGASVILCEASGVLGGTATSGLVGPFMTCYDKKVENQIIRGFFSEFVDRMVAEGGAIHPSECCIGDSKSGYYKSAHNGVTPFSPETLKRVSEDMCAEAGVKLLYHSRVISAHTEDSVIKSAYFSTVAGVEKVNAKVFIDTSGSAALAALSGAEVFRGDENGLVQTASLFFTIKGVDKEALDRRFETLETRDAVCIPEIWEARERGEFPCGTQRLRLFEGMDGIWWVNMAQEDEQVNELDTEALTAAEISQRKQIVKIIEFIKKTVPELKDIELVASAAELGVRESRRIVGRHMFSADDIVNRSCYDERIAVCANSIDIHQKNSVAYTTYTCDENYYIPLSCLISKNIRNLMAAGKCLSADKYAFAAVRVMPPCIAMGEAAGITAALSLGCGCEPANVDVKDVQSAILAGGGYLE